MGWNGMSSRSLAAQSLLRMIDIGFNQQSERALNGYGYSLGLYNG
jgi:hypothetical protein